MGFNFNFKFIIHTGIPYGKELLLVVRINYNKNNSPIGSQEGPQFQFALLFNLRRCPNADGSWGQEFTEVSHGVELNILVEFAFLWVDNYGGRMIVSNPIGASVLIQDEIPICPTSDPMEEI